MGTITIRKRQNGSTAYSAQTRIMQKGATVYQESQTFDRKVTAQPGSKNAGRISPSQGRLRRVYQWIKEKLLGLHG